VTRPITVLIGGVGVMTAATLMFRLIFGKIWGESVGLGATTGVATAFTMLAVSRVRERRMARLKIGVPVRVLFGGGVLLIITKIGLDVSHSGPPALRVALGVAAILSLLLAAFGVMRSTAQHG
jgi:hypothetical protein